MTLVAVLAVERSLGRGYVMLATVGLAKGALCSRAMCQEWIVA